MKKTLALFLVLAFVILGLFSCKKTDESWEEYQTLFVAGSNDEASSSFQPEVQFGNSDYFSKEAMPDCTVCFDDVHYTGSYHWSFRTSLCSYVTDYYETEEGYEFGLKSGTSELTSINLMNKSFFDREPYLDDVENAQAVAEEIADRYASSFLEDPTAYTKYVDMVKSQKERDGKTYEITYYDFTYVKEICGFQTNDLMEIRVTSKGHLARICMLDIGIFKNAEFQIDQDRLNASVLEKTNSLYSHTTYTVNKVDVKSQKLVATPDGYYGVHSLVRLELMYEAVNTDTQIVLITRLVKR